MGAFEHLKQFPSKVSTKIKTHRLTYPATPGGHFNRAFTWTVFILGILWIGVITIINVAAVGYELVPFVSPIYNGSANLWYERVVIIDAWKPVTRSCEASIFPLGQGLTTNVSGFWVYTLVDFLDTRPGMPVDAMIYQATDLQNCSVTSISVSSTTLGEVYVACNTSAGQAVGLLAEEHIEDVPVGVRDAIWAVVNELLASAEPVNVSAAANLWFDVAAKALIFLAPNGLDSQTGPSSPWIADLFSEFSSIGFSYNGYYASDPIIAGGNWNLTFSYTFLNDTSESSLSIAFLPTGDSVPSSDLDEANIVLQKAITLIRLITGDPTFDFWRLMNWLIVTYHWVILYNFGQVAPTTYTVAASGNSMAPIFTGFGTPNFSSPVQYPTTNNIFCNGTLFAIYSDYLTNTILPIADKLGVGQILPPFLPVNDQNRLQPIPTSFVTSYSCTQRQIKGWLSLIISVVVADYALITGAYGFVIFIGEKFKRFKDDQTSLSSLNGSPTETLVRDYRDDDASTPLIKSQEFHNVA